MEIADCDWDISRESNRGRKSGTVSPRIRAFQANHDHRTRHPNDSAGAQKKWLLEKFDLGPERHRKERKRPSLCWHPVLPKLGERPDKSICWIGRSHVVHKRSPTLGISVSTAISGRSLDRAVSVITNVSVIELMHAYFDGLVFKRRRNIGLMHMYVSRWYGGWEKNILTWFMSFSPKLSFLGQRRGRTLVPHALGMMRVLYIVRKDIQSISGYVGTEAQCHLVYASGMVPCKAFQFYCWSEILPYCWSEILPYCWLEILPANRWWSDTEVRSTKNVQLDRAAADTTAVNVVSQTIETQCNTMLLNAI